MHLKRSFVETSDLRSVPEEKRPLSPPRDASWTFLTNHAHVLICLAQEPEARMRDVAVQVGITERAVQRIVADLEEAGIITRVRDGRRNHYEIHREKPLRHPVEAHRTVGDLLGMARNRSLENGVTT